MPDNFPKFGIPKGELLPRDRTQWLLEHPEELAVQLEAARRVPWVREPPPEKVDLLDSLQEFLRLITPPSRTPAPVQPPVAAPAKAPTKPPSAGWMAGWGERTGGQKGLVPFYEELPAGEPGAEEKKQTDRETEVLARIHDDPVGVMTNLEFQMGQRGMDPEIRKTYRAHLARDLHRLGILDIGTAMAYVEQGPKTGVGEMVSQVQEGAARLRAQGQQPMMTPTQFDEIHQRAFARATKMGKKVVVIRDFAGRDHAYDAKSGKIAKYDLGKIDEDDIERVDLPSITLYGSQGEFGGAGAGVGLIPDAAAIAGNLNLGL